ncbi:McrC family protein [soil metagenome]
MKAPLTLFEHEYTCGFNWSDRDLTRLARLNAALGIEVLRPAVRAGCRELQAAQYVGVVRFGERTLQVLPKIYRSIEGDKEQRAREATRNLLYLLAYAGQLPVREHALAPLLRHGSDWFEILTRLFAAHLMEELQRGAFRTYQIVETNSPALKGKWRIAEQLRRPARQHLFSVAFDEFTADNPLNRVFRFVVERLWRLTRDAGNRQMLGELRQWMEEVALLPRVAIAEADAFRLTRLNARFAPLLNLARLFLDGGALQLAAGDTQTFAFVFDMNALFESFLIEFICRHRHEILPPTLAGCELLPQSSGATHYLARRGSRPAFQLKPDLAFRQSDAFPLLLDAKYKRLSKEDSKLGIAREDFYQMHAYAHRYACRRVVLLYPQTAEMSQPISARFVIEKTDIPIIAATLNLQIALGSKPGRDLLVNELKNILREDA